MPDTAALNVPVVPDTPALKVPVVPVIGPVDAKSGVSIPFVPSKTIAMSYPLKDHPA